MWENVLFLKECDKRKRFCGPESAKRCGALSKDAINPSLFFFLYICVRDFLEKKEEESSSASSSSSYFILRVPHGSLWLASADWNTTDRPHVTGFTFQQQVSVLSAAAEKTRQRARWCSGYRREPHTHTHERECAVHRRAGEKNTTVADQVAIKTVHSDPCLSLSLSLSNFLTFLVFLFVFKRDTQQFPSLCCFVIVQNHLFYKSSWIVFKFIFKK